MAGIHTQLSKRHSRALGRLSPIVLVPIAGAMLYAVPGINRVPRTTEA